ncbi:MAG: ImmA/IrrE family metallo-endopeptidase [Bacteroidetes bacterium]|nr:MAG: ImmA/IrrE family metallo-endopeptidase [Bacteroidota bacterium]
MPKRESLNRNILKWARKSAKVSLEKAAARISKSCKSERIRDWESPEGREFPTVKQVEKLAKLYRRPAEVFYMSYIPPDYPLLKDFRSNKEEGMDTGLVFMMREIQERQDWLSTYLKSSKAKILPFVGKYNIKDNPAEVAADIRRVLAIRQAKPGEKALKVWIDQAEKKGIYISLSSNYHTRLKLSSDSFSVFAVSDKYAPFIFINSEAWEHDQIFALIHELAHIWINVSGISVDVGMNENKVRNLHIVERFCRVVAEEALLPQDLVEEFLRVKGELKLKNISTAGRRLGISNQDFLLRSKKLGLLEESLFKQLYAEAETAWKVFLYKESVKPKSKGGPNYYIMQLRRGGRSFSSTVLSLHKSGKLSAERASKLLNVKEGNFGKFEKFVFGK